MARIVFESTPSEVKFHNPLRGFAEDRHTLEIRRDPLLGDVSVYNPYLKDKAKAFFGECDQELIRRLAIESEKGCFLCGDKVEKGTPAFTPDFIAGGRLKKGESVLFPNLFSLGTYHPVIRLCRAHFLKLSEFSSGLLADGFAVGQTFLKIVYEKDASAAYTAVTANYLFPAGASLVHPHLQMITTPVPYSYLSRIIEAAVAYFRENRSVYFLDLIREEEPGPRYVGRRGGWSWIAPFSPLGNNELMAVHGRASDFCELSGTDLQDLASGISRVLMFYESLGHLSFNYAVYSVRGGAISGAGAESGFRCLVKIITRQNPYPNYRNDDYFLQKLLQSELIITPPEELATRMKEFF